ncbi:MAG: carboxymuconolactone decarboxylase family protein [Gammaproteobacteria bacterium]|nr:carboxymuconolactone decarboxylase family protein [Gammaproteobacteria bacterium]
MSDASRIEKGKAAMQKLFGRAPDDAALSSDFMQVTVGNLFGDIWSRPGLELAERSMITIAALTVLGRENELKTHLMGAKNIGIPREKVEEMMLHLAHYGGWPTGVAGLRKVAEVYAPPKTNG